MRRGSRFNGRVAFLLIVTLAVAPLAFGGCGSSSNPTPPPTPQPLSVSASPAGGNYAAAENVELAASGAGSSSATIYYTTDLSDPSDDTNAGRIEYTAAIAIGTDNTVLKFFAMPAEGDPTDVALEGYTFETSPYGEDWAESGHGDVAAEAWRHWDEDGEVQTSCAKCHSGGGFKDWAMDGTVDAAAPLPMGLECTDCHSGIPNTLYDDLGTYPELDHVVFPSGDTVTLASDNNLCISCHQGRNSMVQVDAADPNDVVQVPDYDSYSFINIHYYPAAASMFGNEVRGGYQYLDDDAYVSRNTFPSHPDSLSTCTGCHMRESEANHTWTPDLDRCLECHDGTSFTTLSGSPGANYTAIQNALTELYAEIQAHAIGLGYPIFYDSHSYPYFFNEGGPAAYPNKYDNFDEMLLRAAYNYQFGQKDPCAYLHNGTYLRQLLHDSIVDLGGTPTDIPPGRPGYTAPGDIFVAKTNEFHQSGHGASGTETFRHWDEDPAPQEISTSCSRCHSSPGFQQWAVDGMIGVASKPWSVVGCNACHDSNDLYDTTATRWDNLLNTALRPVMFPSGDTADLGNSSNVCMGCHQGRNSTVQVDAATPNTVVQAPVDYDSYSFINIHYFAAAASYFGSQVRGGYQYTGAPAYKGQQTWTNSHDAGGFNDCTGCHMEDGDHTFEVNFASCSGCHGGTDFTDMGIGVGDDYDTIQAMEVALLAAIKTYGLTMLPNPAGVDYDDHAYPYWFHAGELPIYPNKYDDFNFNMLTAAYNYQTSKKEPCGYVHNAVYIQQVLYDSLDIMDDDTLNGSVVGFTRP